jgi:hypothetical protein
VKEAEFCGCRNVQATAGMIENPWFDCFKEYENFLPNIVQPVPAAGAVRCLADTAGRFHVDKVARS